MRFVACDWGTSNFRLRWVDGTVRRELKTGEGTAKLASAGADRPALDTAIKGHVVGRGVTFGTYSASQ